MKLRLYTENQLPGGPGSELKVCGGWVVGGGGGGVGKNFIIRIRISSILLKLFEYIRIFVTHCVCWLLSQMGNLIFRNQNILHHILFSQKEFSYGF